MTRRRWPAAFHPLVSSRSARRRPPLGCCGPPRAGGAAMSDDDTPTNKTTVSRRGALGLIGAVGAGAAAAPLLGATPAAAATMHVSPTVGRGATPVQGLHLTVGADPTRQMVASWITDGAVSKPRVVYGTLDGGFGASALAETRTYVDGTSGRTVFIHHASIDHLRPNTEYIYSVQHQG